MAKKSQNGAAVAKVGRARQGSSRFLVTLRAKKEGKSVTLKRPWREMSADLAIKRVVSYFKGPKQGYEIVGNPSAEEMDGTTAQ